MAPRSWKPVLLLIGDAAVFVAAIFAAPFIRNLGAPEPGILPLYRFAAPFLIGLWTAGFGMFGLYDIAAAKNGPAFYDRLLRALAFNFALTVGLFYLIPEFRLRPLLTLFVIFVTQLPLVVVWRLAAHALFGRLSKDRVLFYGHSGETEELERFLRENPQLGFVPIGTIHTDTNSEEQVLEAAVRTRGVTTVVVTPHIRRTPELMRSLLAAIPLGTAVTDLPRFYEAVKGKVPVSLIGEAWFLENLAQARRPKYELAKRLLDLGLALTIGAVALFLLPLIALAILASTPFDVIAHRRKRARPGDGIVFFRQERVGRNGVSFPFLKFRSQVLGAERYGSEKREGPDPRAYPAGTFLRRAYLDELPQLWNVIRGDMSFVGPRPERPEFVRELERTVPFYRMRELVLPGITGWAQINMQNDASVSDAPEKIQYDLYYIKNRSLALDLMIILKTVLKLLQRSGR